MRELIKISHLGILISFFPHQLKVGATAEIKKKKMSTRTNWSCATFLHYIWLWWKESNVAYYKLQWTNATGKIWGFFFFFTFIDNICFAKTAAAFSWNIVKHFLAYLFHCLSNILESVNLRSDFLKKLYKTHNLQELTLNNNVKKRKKSNKV